MSGRLHAARRHGLAAAMVIVGLGCGGEVPHGGVPEVPTTASASASTGAGASWEAVELLPADLDVVLRIDLGRVRATVGAEPMKELADRALGRQASDELLRDALEQADVVLVGLRAADVTAGDRVLVVEAPRASLEFDSGSWRRAEPAGAGVQPYDAIDFVPRDGTARVIDIQGRLFAFVSPVEVDAVGRVLRLGPDAARPEPAARGLVSLDWRVGPPGARLENRYPSFAALLAGIDRVTAVVEPRGRDLSLSARLICRDERAAGRAARFLKTIQGGSERTDRFAVLFEGLRIEAVSSLVRIEWLVPAERLLALVRPETSVPPPTTPSSAPPPAPPLQPAEPDAASAAP